MLRGGTYMHKAPKSTRCKDSRKDCFAITQEGNCKALSDTDFGNRQCPFYKPKNGGDKNGICK